LRDVKILSPFWTYCHNFRSEKDLPYTSAKEEIRGGIFASGLYEGYVRIPWHGTVEPEVSVPCVCGVCGRRTQQGITIVQDGRTLGFCTNRHYVEWWMTVHDDPSVTPDGLATPDEFYKK
jgi:hypothetical protein